MAYSEEVRRVTRVPRSRATEANHRYCLTVSLAQRSKDLASTLANSMQARQGRIPGPSFLKATSFLDEFDVAPLQEAGQRRGNFEFVAPRQSRQVSDRAPAVEKEQDPALSAGQLASKRGDGLAGDGAEHSRGPEAAFLWAKFRHDWLSPFRF